jgi:DNA-directed RNA polymerase specialized sigma24 family protein
LPSAGGPPSLTALLAARRATAAESASGRRREAEHAGHDPPAGDDHELSGALALLDGLPARQRAALTLRYVHDLPDAAIARALRCRPGTVSSLLSRGREAVRAGMEHELQEPS